MKKLQLLLLLACCAFGIKASAQTIIIQNNTPFHINNVDFTTLSCSPPASFAGSVGPYGAAFHGLCTAPGGADVVSICLYDVTCIPVPPFPDCFSAECGMPTQQITLCDGTIIHLDYDCVNGTVTIF